MDNLKKSADAFSSLLNIEYHIKAGKKSDKIIDFIIDFDKADFFHLVGLHKLKDIDVLVSADIDKEDIFDKIMSEEITYEQLSKSVFFDKVKDRIDNFSKLESLLNNGDLVFRYYKNKVKGSIINADYVFYFQNTQPKIYFFIVKRDKTSDYRFCGCSFFSSADNKYIMLQPKYKLIYVSRYNALTNQEEILINKIK